VEQQEYKLALHLAITVELGEPRICLLCLDFIRGSAYRIVIEEPFQLLYFDEDCFNSLLALGWEFFRSRQQESKN
jgi:hypothetical protein